MRGAIILLLLSLLATPTRAQDLVGHGGPVRALALLADGTLASAGFDQAVILWDPARGLARQVVRWHGAALTALVPLPGGGFASAGEDGRVALWSPASLVEPRRVLEADGVPIGALAVAADRRLAAGLRDGTILVWPESGPPHRLIGHAGPVHGLAFTASGLASAGYDGTLRVWEAAGDRLLLDAGAPLNALVALPGGTLAAAGADGAVRLLAPGAAPRVLDAGPRPVVALAASPDGGLLAAAALGGGVGLWAPEAGLLVRLLDGTGLPVWSLAFAADGATLWSGGQDRHIRRWDARTGTPRGVIAAQAEPAIPAGADPEGARVFRACAACHALRPGEPPMAGPTLHGLFGRRMGTVPGYAYSARLARGDIIWTPETVAELFTRGPDELTPGTRMPVQRVSDAAELAALVRFLAVATR